jgi:hypothetical protein
MSKKQRILIFIIVLGLITVSFYMYIEPPIGRSFGVLFYPPIPPTTIARFNRYTEIDACARQEPLAIGEIEFQPLMTSSFSATLRLSGLLPNHWYMLTINGTQNEGGNDLLKEACQTSSNDEGHCDFSVLSDDQGKVNSTIDRQLPQGQYIVKYFITDPIENYCILLYDKDASFTFEIK